MTKRELAELLDDFNEPEPEKRRGTFYRKMMRKSLAELIAIADVLTRNN